MDAKLDALGTQLNAFKDQLDQVRSTLEQLVQLTLHQPAVRLVFDCYVGDQFYHEAKSMIITDVQKFTASIQPVDAKNNPAPVDGVPVWSSSNPAVLTVTASEDGMSATITAVGPLGTAQVAVTADADLGEGVSPITGVLDVEVKASNAVSLSIATTAPEAA
jgi:hypothetical protein